ncbi:zinc finger CCCH domain-containing protein 19-like isoform X2 [Andrographis paniculata]|uniref:zinc finger CCCH domain-containing protein 19-like isoform X2 n=1 Tax=Andrographis paniculata TaxID=175694 RepID=UPI0021E82EC3|nr:zinc finger CCCH domain-containing protein 19-like isoform X2 [Andrographis paniculata]
MEGRENNDQVADMVEAVDSSTDVNKPYELGTKEEEEKSKIVVAGNESEEECVAVKEFVESSVDVCMESGDTAAQGGMVMAGEAGFEENRAAMEEGSRFVVKPVALEGGGEIVGARSVDPSAEVEVEEDAESIGDGDRVAQVDVLLVEPKRDMIAEQEKTPAVDAKLDMIAGDTSNLLIDSAVDAGRDDLVNPHLTVTPEEEIVTVIDGKVDIVITDAGDEEKSYDFPMDTREDELQVITQVDSRKDDSVSAHLTGKPEEQLAAVIDCKEDVSGDEKPNDGRGGAFEGMDPLDYKSERGADDVESVKEMIGMARELVDGLTVETSGKMDNEKAGVLANDSDIGTAERPSDEVGEKLNEKAGVLANDSDVATDERPSDEVGGKLDEEAGVLVNDADVVTAERPSDKAEEKLDLMITEDDPVSGDLKIETEVNPCADNSSQQEQVNEFSGSVQFVGDDVLSRNAENNVVDCVEGLDSGKSIAEDKDIGVELLKDSELDVSLNMEENLQERLEDAAVKEEASTGDYREATGVGVELESKDMSTELMKDSELDEPVNVPEKVSNAAVKEDVSAGDFKKETDVGVELESKDLEFLEMSKFDEPVNVQETLENAGTGEKASTRDIVKELELKSVLMEGIQPADAVVGAEGGVEMDQVVAHKGRDDDGTTEMEETPSDVDGPGQDSYDSPTAPQDEEDDKMVTEEEIGTQDVAMEMETDINDSGKTSGGKRKRGKVSKGSASKATGKPSRKKVGEDVCFICFDGGELVICDRRGCPKAYHPSCVNRDEAFFKSKGRWNCGWHLCSSCGKNAQYMCYTCPFSLCKSCGKDEAFSCVRGNKGFCETCMRIVTLIENEQTLKDSEIDFDDKNSWEYLFKDYFIDLKAKLSLSSEEIAEAKSPCKGANISGPSKQESSEVRADANDGGSCSDDPTENVEPTRPKRRRVKKQSKSLSKEEELTSTNVEAGDKAVVLAENPEWASKELLEFVSHMKDGDTAVLSQFDVQALLLEYIKRNKLRDPRRKSQIICDARLENLFGKPRVGHFEMLKLLESHFLARDEQNDDVQGSVVDAENNIVDVDANADPLTKDGKDRKRKYRKKGSSRGPQSNLDDYAAIDMHNIGLIYLRRKLMEDLLEDIESFHDKVVGTFVRIRISGSTSKQDLYRLVQVVGTSKGPDSYKIGKKNTDIMVEILNLDKTEHISIDTISNQEFSEEECKRLRQSIKCGLISRLTVGEILDKTMELQAARVNDWLESETMRLSHLRDRASDLGRRKELRECVEKLQLLKKPEERQRRLEDIPEIHADPKMDPSYESEDKDSENEDSRQDAFTRSRGSSFSRRGKVPMSPRNDSVKEPWSGAGKVSKTWEPSRDLSNNSFSITTGHNDEAVIETSSTYGRDRGRHESSNLDKINSIPNSEPADWARHSVARPESSSGMPSVTSGATSVAMFGENYVKINESEKMWHYQDPSGKVQGPFSMVQLRKWNNTGYFPSDLKIWRTKEKQGNAILLADALAGKIPKVSPSLGNTPLATNIIQSSHALTGDSSKASGTFSRRDKERLNADQMPKLPTEKLLGAIQSPSGGGGGGGVLSSPTPIAPNMGIHSSASASVLSSVLQAVASSSVPTPQTGSLSDAAVPLHAQSTAAGEPPMVQMHGNPQATVQPAQNLQTNTQGWAAQPQGYGWNASNVQNPSGSFSNSGTPSGPQPDVWRPQNSQPSMHPSPAAPDPSWAMGPAGSNAAASMGVRPDNPNMGWGSMPANPNMGWGNPPAGTMNMNWGPAMQVAPPGNTPGWVAPPGNTGPNVQGMVPDPGWAPTQNWGPPPVQGQVPGPGWGMPGGGTAGGPAPPPPAQGPPPGNGNGWGHPSGNPGGPMPQGNTNQGWGQAGNQGVWNGEANHMGGQYSGQRGRDPGGYNGGRPWNRQQSFGGGGGGGPRHGRKRDTLCPFNTNGRCRKGQQCDYLHA